MKMLRLVLFVALCSSAAATEKLAISAIRGSGVTVDVRAVFDQTPPNGVMPFIVKIQNNTQSRGRWQVNVKIPPWQSKMQVTENYEVEAGSSRTFLLNAPIPVRQHNPPEAIGYTLEMTGTGMDLQNAYSGTSRWGGGSRQFTQFIALVGDASEKTWGAIDDARKATSEAFIGSRVDLDAIPDNPVSLTGVDSMWITPADYAKFSAGQSAAVQAWVARGGELHITGAEVPPALVKLRGEANANQPAVFGLGSIHLADFEAGEAMAEHIIGRMKTIAPHVESIPPTEPPLLKRFVTKPKTPVVAIMLFSVLFAVVIGPVNLFVLAKRGKRHLLFFTTPAISILASVIMLGIIILGDGVGGDGARAGLVFSLPSQNEMQLYQHQRSRTGVLTKTSFKMPESSSVRQIPRYGSGFHEHNDPSELFISGATHSGDWFRSRSVPEQVIEMNMPSRAKLEITSSEPLTVVSSFDVTLAPFYYRDENGRLWHAESLPQGRGTQLTPATEEQLAGFLDVTASAGKRIEESIKVASAQPGHFVGSVTEPAKVLVPTLTSISWKEEECYFAGEVAR